MDLSTEDVFEMRGREEGRGKVPDIETVTPGTGY